MRVGLGFDIHAFAEGRKLVLGGLTIPFQKGLLGHSDGDVLLHAISDAILGAAADGDIGLYFPDTDESIKDILLVFRVWNHYANGLPFFRRTSFFFLLCFFGFVFISLNLLLFHLLYAELLFSTHFFHLELFVLNI